MSQVAPNSADRFPRAANLDRASLAQKMKRVLHANPSL